MKTTLLTTAVLMLVYGVWVRFAPQPKVVATQSQWQFNQHVLEKYLGGDLTKDVVVVGSSLTQRLRTDPKDPDICNLGLAGESSLTGLEAVIVSGQRPRCVLVEINEPFRDTNRKLLDAASGRWKRKFRVFMTENIPANLILSYIASFRGKGGEARHNEGVRRELVAARLKQEAAPVPAETMQQRIGLYREVVRKLGLMGVEVVFFEMPVFESIAATPAADQVRRAFHEAFSRSRFIDAGELAKGVEIRTVDGVHLSPDEADAVLGNLRSITRICCPTTNVQAAPR